MVGPTPDPFGEAIERKSSSEDSISHDRHRNLMKDRFVPKGHSARDPEVQRSVRRRFGRNAGDNILNLPSHRARVVGQTCSLASAHP
jgi:hypothetical protein